MNSTTPQEALDRIAECRRTKSKTLDLSKLGLTNIPVEISELVWLERLYLENNQLTKIEGLEKLSNLSTLWLENNQLTKIEGLDKLSNLSELLLYNNQLTKIEGLENLSKLSSLWLQNNKLAKIEGLEKLGNLSSLELVDNQIIKIEGLENLSNLSSLGLHNNKLTKIEGLEKLGNLSSLGLNDNQITNLLPLQIFLKKRLKILYVKNIGNYKNYINLYNNPLQIPDIETVMRGNDAILAYFEEREQKEQYEIKINSKIDISTTPSVKMILFGNSGAGKTNLSKYLREGIFNKNDRDSTHGILIENWLQPEGENLLAHIWDFGGQEYYHGAYRLFMTNKTVFIVLWEEATNQNFGNKRTLVKKEEKKDDTYEELVHFELQYWLDNIRHYAPNSPILLLQNKVDKPEQKQRHSPDLFTEYGITDDFSISLLLGSDSKNVKQYRDIQHFKQELIAILAENTYHDQTLTRLKLRDDLIDLQEENTKSDNPFLAHKEAFFISVNDFEKIMKTIKVDIVLKNTIDVLDWLHTRGIVLFYKDNAALKDKAFLQPKRVIDAIYDILNKEILKKEGQFSIKDLKKTSEIDPTTAIEIMLQMELIFSVPNAENQYIAPQYLPEKHALQDLYEIASEEIQQLSYSVKLPLFYYRRVLQQLILHYGKNQDKDCKAYFWKHGILIKKDGIRLLIKGLYPNENESEGIISIATDKKSGFLDLQKEVFSEIKSIAYGYKRVEVSKDVYENYDGPGEDVTDKIWKEEIEKNPEQYTSSYSKKELEKFNNYFEKTNEKEQKINQKIEVSSDGTYFCSYSDLLEKAEQGNLRIQGVSKIDKTSTKLLTINSFQMILDKKIDRPLNVFVSYSHDDLALQQELKKHLMPLVRSERIEVWIDNMIPAGDDWNETILTNLRQSDVVILLLSANFVSSNYIWNIELKETWKLKQEGKLVLPIYGKEFFYHDLQFKTLDNQKVNLGDFQFIPKNNEKDDRVEAINVEAINSWDNKDKALSKVVGIISDAIKNYKP